MELRSILYDTYQCRFTVNKLLMMGRGILCQNKFVKLVHLIRFIIKKFVTMHGHMNVKNLATLFEDILV